MLARGFKFALLVYQLFWMLVVLPGHIRGQIVLGPDNAAARPACCSEDAGPPAKKSSDPISPDRKARCAVCYQAHGYTLPPVFDVDLAPTGLCAIRRLIGPAKWHTTPFVSTYDATAPPV